MTRTTWRGLSNVAVVLQAIGDRHLGGLILLACLAGTGVGLLKVITALYAIDLQASPLQLGLIAGAQTAGLLLTSLPCGVLVERFGALRLFCLGSLLACALLQLVPLWASPWFLLLMILLVGLSMPLRFVSLNAVFMQQLARVGETKAGWFRGAQMIGLLLIGPTLAGLVSSWLGLAGSWTLIGLVFALPILLAPWVLEARRSDRPLGEPLSLAALGRQLALLRDETELRRNSLLDFSVQATAMYFAFFIVAITVQHYGWSAAHAAALLSAHGLTFILALFFLGRILRSHERASVTGALLVCGFALLGLGLGTTALWLWSGALLLGLGLGMLQVVTLSTYARSGARLGHGRIAGLAALVGPGGGLTGCLLGGLLGESFGLQHLFLLFIPLFLGFLLLTTLRSQLSWPFPRRVS